MSAAPAAVAQLVDLRTAELVGHRVAAAGPSVSSVDRARLREEFADIVPEAEAMVSAFTGLSVGSRSSHGLVVARREWVTANLRGVEQLLEPFARRVIATGGAGVAPGLRRRAFGVQIGALLGYLARKVLGQYDLFVAPEDEGVLYFVGPNIIELERRHRFDPHEFRLWIALHEVAHRVQFGAVDWLRGYVTGLVDTYLDQVELDPRRLIEGLKRGVAELRKTRGGAPAPPGERAGIVTYLMTPSQLEVFRQMQAVMSLLEGHGNFVMDSVAADQIAGLASMRGALHQRRHKRGVERAVQRAIGLEAKVAQYESGERFVARVVREVGMEGFNRVWRSPEDLPTLEEIRRPEAWVERLAA